MKVHKYGIIISFFIGLTAILISIALQFVCGCWVDFLYDIAIGVFSGAFLVVLIEVFAYRVARRQALEHFRFSIMVHKDIIKKFQIYDSQGDIAGKFICFEDICINEYEITRAYQEICFIFDCGNRTRNYLHTLSTEARELAGSLFSIKNEPYNEANYTYVYKAFNELLDELCNDPDKFQKIIYGMRTALRIHRDKESTTNE